MVEREEQISKLIDESLVEYVQSSFDSMAKIMTSWPPIQGQSANDGEESIRHMVMESCEKSVISKTSNHEHIAILRARACDLINEGISRLKEQCQKKIGKSK